MFVGKVYFKDGNWEKTDSYNSPEGPVIYEIIRLINGVPLFWKAHHSRLLHSLILLKIPLPDEEINYKEIIRALVEVNLLEDSNLRINIRYDNSTLAIQSIEIGQVPVIIPPKELYENGVKSGVLNLERPNPNVKKILTDLRQTVAETIERKQLWDVVLRNAEGELTEGGRTNLFFIRKNEVYTSPVVQVLPGITRMMILHICSDLHIPVHEKTIRFEELETFESAFFTGTSPGIIPIKNIDNAGFDVQNTCMKNLSEAYRKLVKNDIAHYAQSL